MTIISNLPYLGTLTNELILPAVRLSSDPRTPSRTVQITLQDLITLSAGPRGPAGIAGETGPTGPAGISGYSGLNGASSFSGYSGYSGQRGYSGYSGINAPNPVQVILIATPDETTALTAGTAKITFRMPYAFVLSEVRISLTTAQTSGNIVTVDINKNGTSILSTKLTVDNNQKTSKTAATPAVISNTALADDDEITIDIDQIGNGTAAGLKVYLIGIKQ